MNGFDDLERQLRGKVSARAGRRRWPLMRTLAVAAALSVSAGAVTAAATGVIGGPGTEEAGVALFNDVVRDTQDGAVCRPHGPDRGPAEITTLPASDGARRAFPALRRPATAHERGFARRNGRMAGMEQVLSGGARELRATDGTRFMLLLTAGRGRRPGPWPGLLPGPARRARSPRPRPRSEHRRRRARTARRSGARVQRQPRPRGPDPRPLRPTVASRARCGTFSDVAMGSARAASASVACAIGRDSTIAGLVPAKADHVVIRSRSHPGRPRSASPCHSRSSTSCCRTGSGRASPSSGALRTARCCTPSSWPGDARSPCARPFDIPQELAERWQIRTAADVLS